MRRCRARLPAALHVTDADTKSGGRRIVRGLPTRTEPAQLRPDTVARLVCFTILTRARSGRTKTTQVRLLTTLLDPDLYPAAELASLYSKRWIIEIALLHLKRTVRGTGKTLRGRSPELVRQEAWALLLAHNLIAGLAARAAALAGFNPGEIVFTAVLSPARVAVTADTCCPHCGKRPTSANAPTASLDAAIAAVPPAARHASEPPDAPPRNGEHGPSEPADYTITIVPSDLPKTDISPREVKGSTAGRGLRTCETTSTLCCPAARRARQGQADAGHDHLTEGLHG